MAWIYKSFVSAQAGKDLLDQVQNALNQIPPTELPSVKIATSDQKEGAARAVIYYSTTSPGQQDTPIADATWNYKVFSTRTDYEKMYGDLAEFLNNDKTVSDDQKMQARVTMTNAQSHDSYLVLWYR